MDYQNILTFALKLPKAEQLQLIINLSQCQTQSSETEALHSHGAALINKQSACPHCNAKHYIRFGKFRGAQRFKCKNCGKYFNEYTGTWLEGIHKKMLAAPYLSLMIEQKSLDKIRKTLGINKKTAFDWRHKILSSCEQNTGDEFGGIVESDETFFEHSEKGNRHLKRPSRKRGGGQKTRGISDEKVAVIVSADRKGSLKMTLSAMGRISKSDIVESFQKPLQKQTVLCSDGHASYKGYSRDNCLKHIVLRADLKQYLKQGIYHIQHINELHNRLKKWLDGTFWGVSTKYLQNYLNWFYLCEKWKRENFTVEKMALFSLKNTSAIKQYRYNNFAYNCLLTTQK